MQAERQLLFGLLALQNGFVSREQLVAAFSVWTLDKHRGLDQILTDQRALEPALCAALAILVDKQVERHDQDPVKSLDAFSTFDMPICEALRSLADPALDASLAHIRTGRGSTGDDGLATFNPSMGEASSQGMRFRILRPHARGGLGQVSVALDRELNREVALKEIQLLHADDQESRARFVLEAEVTGGLEHPGIVPVYGLGYYADGRPFYAMKFIKGDSLKEAIDRYHASRLRTGAASDSNTAMSGSAARPDTPAEPGGLLDLRQLLGRFVGVCNALQYAHDRRVLHRDIKPGNIMLGKYGETLIVDWGLAKVQGHPDQLAHTAQGTAAEPPLSPSSVSSSIEATLAGRAVGTPAYMSPEQAAGRLDELGAASDVYSLGATLYHLLTGKPPFEGHAGAVLGRVDRGEFRTPRSLNPDLPAALEAICLKAMSLRPDGRYPSARSLADDLEHWLADEPVTAFPEPITARLARFARRHRALVQTGLAALFILASSYLHFAKRQMDLAEAHRQQLQKEANVVLTALDRIFKEVSAEDVVDEPALHPVQKTVASFYGEYVQSHYKDTDAGMGLDVARLNDHVAMMTLTIGTNPESLQYLRKAEEIYRKLAAAPSTGDSERVELQVAHAHNLVEQAKLLYATHDYSNAGRLYQEAISTLQPLVKQKPGSPQVVQYLADAFHNYGILKFERHENRAAQELLEQGRQQREQLLSVDRTSRDYKRDLATSYGWLGDVELELEQDQPAQAAYQEAQKYREELVKSDRDGRDHEARFQLARSYENSAGLFLRRNHRSGVDENRRANLEQAKQHYEQSRRLRQNLIRENPRNSTYKHDFGWNLTEIGEVHLELGELDQAQSAFLEGFGVWDELVRRDATDMIALTQRAKCRLNRAQLQMALADKAGATGLGTSAVAQAQKFVEEADTDLRALKGDEQPERPYLRAMVQTLRAELMPSDRNTSLDDAVRLLNQARTLNKMQLYKLQQDRGFRSLRDNPQQFKTLMHRLGSAG